MAAGDKLIEEFFQEMKANDEALPIMPIPVLPKPRRIKWWPYAVAASLALAVVAYVIANQPPTRTVTQVEITLSGTQASSTESLVTNTSSMEIWESPTQSLINDF